MFGFPLQRDELFDFRPIPRELLLVGSYYRYIYHVPSCEWASKIEHRRYFLDADDAHEYGYRQCHECWAYQAGRVLTSQIPSDILNQVRARRQLPRIIGGESITVIFENGETETFSLGRTSCAGESLRIVNVESAMGRAVFKARLGDTVICSPEGQPAVFALILRINDATLIGPEPEHARPR